MPLAQGVGARVQPFAGGLVGTAGGDARPAVDNVAHGARGLTSVAPDFVTDAVPSFTAPEYRAQGV
ncbi:hypothetical protein ACWC9U_29785 [Streptomyces sp. 900116325]